MSEEKKKWLARAAERHKRSVAKLLDNALENLHVGVRMPEIPATWERGTQRLLSGLRDSCDQCRRTLKFELVYRIEHPNVNGGARKWVCQSCAVVLTENIKRWEALQEEEDFFYAHDEER